MIKRNIFLLFALITVLAFGACEANNETSKNEVKTSVETKGSKWPEWSEATEVVIDESTKGGPTTVRKTFDIATARENISIMRYLVENTESGNEYPYHNVWKANLGLGLLKLGEYELAANYLKELLELPDEALYGKKEKNGELKIMTVGERLPKGRIVGMYLKALAGLGEKEKLISEYNEYEQYLSEAGKVQSWSLISAAWAMSKIGEKEEAEKLFARAIKPETFGNISPWMASSNVLSAASFAYNEGDYNKVESFVERLLAEGEDSTNPDYFLDYDVINGKKASYFAHHWKTSYRLAREYRKLAKLAKVGRVADFNNLKDGEYSSTSTGYMFTPIDVTITVEGGVVKKIKAIQEEPVETRSGTALETIPQKIIEQQSLNIDGIASATITSESIKISVAKALIQAKQ